MAQKWNLQDIRPQGAPKAQPPRSVGTPQLRPKQDIAPRAPEQSPAPEYDPDLSTLEITDGNAAKRKRVLISSIIALCLIGAGYGVNLLLAGATVTVQPKVADIALGSEISAKTTPQVGELGYELLTLEATGERQVKATGKENVHEQAQGKIFVYNTSDVSQRLIKNTRFENKDGLIFRIQESIEVPPAKGGTPGKVAADVFADGPGEQYNIPPQRFTVPGLKGSDQFDKMYGESEAAFTGGFDGEKYMLDEAELATATQALQLELRNTLLGRLKSERPAGFVVFDDAVAISFESMPATDYGDSLATIKERARLQVPLFKEDAFAAYIATQGYKDYKNDRVIVSNPEALTFTYTSATTTVSDLSGRTTLDFMLKGTAHLIWQVDEAKLTSELLGIKKKDTNAIFLKYGTIIQKASVEIRPFWKTVMPKNADDITIETVSGTP